MIEFTVNAVPVAQPRQRHRVVTTADGKSFAQNYTPARDPVNVFKTACQFAASQTFTAPLTGPVELWLTFVLPRPKSLTKKRGTNPRQWADKKPDIDNLAKSLCDALNGIAWHDDSQIVDSHVSKVVAAASELPRVIVRFGQLVDDPESYERRVLRDAQRESPEYFDSAPRAHSLKEIT